MSTSSKFFGVLFAGALAAWYLPDVLGAGDAEPQAVTDPGARIGAAQSGSKPTPRREAWLDGETVLKRQPDGHFYANVTIDGRDCRVLVDTGASFVALTADDAHDLGIDWDDSQLIAVGRGASGVVYGMPVTLDRVELGGFEASKVRAAVIPKGLDITLLGQSFLSQLRDVRIDGDEMRIGG